MASVSSVNIERVLWGCNDRGISISALADAVNMAPDKLTSILNGDKEFSISQLKKIAQFFNKGILFFLEPGPVDENRLRTAGFRTLANENPDLSPKLKSLIERVERQRQILLGLLDTDEDTSIKEFHLPQIADLSINDATSKIREWLQIGKELNFTTYRAAIEKHGILVFRSNGFAGKWQIPNESSICGFSIFHERFPIIFIRKQESEKRQLFTLAHELGHLLIHSTGFVDELTNLYSHIGKEREANAFAGKLLVPDNFLNQIELGNKPQSHQNYDLWLKDFSKLWGVSVEVILRRLLDSNLLDRTHYESYRNWKSRLPPIEKSSGTRKYRFNEPKHIFGDTFVRTVLDSLHARQINITRASSYLDNLKIADIHKLERAYNAF